MTLKFIQMFINCFSIQFFYLILYYFKEGLEISYFFTFESNLRQKKRIKKNGLEKNQK
jgi:hypothetical protein